MPPDPFDSFRENYEAMPVIVRHAVSLEEFAFMSDEQKAAMWDDLTVPDDGEDPL